MLPSLILHPHRPRFLAAATLAGCSIAAAVLCASDLPFIATLGAVLLLAVFAWQSARSMWRNIPRLLIIHDDGRCEAEFADDRRIQGTLATARTVQAWLVTVRLEWPGGAMPVPVTADMLSPEDFRRLRVHLRWAGVSGREVAER